MFKATTTAPFLRMSLPASPPHRAPRWHLPFHDFQLHKQGHKLSLKKYLILIFLPTTCLELLPRRYQPRGLSWLLETATITIHIVQSQLPKTHLMILAGIIPNLCLHQLLRDHSMKKGDLLPLARTGSEYRHDLRNGHPSLHQIP